MENCKNKIFYQCFSWKQRDFIEAHGIKYLLKCKHFETERSMYIFIYDTEGLLDSILQQWIDTKPR